MLPVNCEQLKKEDIRQILEKLLCEFPLSVMDFYMLKWVVMLESFQHLKVQLVE